jgi:ATP-dependent Clp protease, protease subunit
MSNSSCTPIFTTVCKDKAIKGKVDDIVNLPKIVVVNKFNEESAKQFYQDMTEAENSDQDIIPVVIDSYGGQVYTLLAMVDYLRASKKKIATISISKSMSCGAVLFSCGTDGYRFVTPMSTILIHDVSSWVYGKVEDIKIKAQEVERLNNMIYEIMDRNCGHEAGYFQKIVHDKKGHADWFLTPEEAVEHKLANHIRIPRFEVTISTETKLV